MPRELASAAVWGAAKDRLARAERKANGHGGTMHGNGAAVEKPLRFLAQRFSSVPLATTVPYLLKGFIPREGLVVVWGEPKCGKSFWTLDVVLHVALGWLYRGRRVKQGGVIYVCCEGEHGFGRRIAAFRQHHGLTDEDPDFFLIATRLNLVADRDELIADIRAQVGEIEIAAVVVDTLNRSIQGSESSDEEMGNYVKAADAIKDAFNCAVIIVHHCGLAADRPRGHTSLTGAVDAQIAVSKKGGIVTALCEHMKDGEDGAAATSKLEVVEVGTDDDGDTLTSCVVVESDETPSAAATSHGLTANQQTMLAILADAGRGGLTVDEWNTQARAVGLGAKRRQDLYDHRIALKRAKLVYEWQDRWVKSQ